MNNTVFKNINNLSEAVFKLKDALRYIALPAEGAVIKEIVLDRKTYDYTLDTILRHPSVNMMVSPFFSYDYTNRPGEFMFYGIVFKRSKE
jgi:hypothetical protein